MIFSEQILRVKSGSTNIPAILIGNKIDLADKRKITAEEAEQKARSWSIKFIETSAKTKYNVDKAFCELMRIVRPLKGTINTDVHTSKHPLHTTDTETNKKCCVIL
jgi:Ras-related protein Ral-A